MPTEQFATLSITPHTPPRRSRGAESSSSSLEATPEGPPRRLRLGITDLNLGLFDASGPVLPSYRRGRAAPVPPVRSFSFADVFSLHNDAPGHYADFSISPLSSSSLKLCN